MRKISEVLRLHYKLGLSVRQSANATGTSRGSVSNYCIRFKELGVTIDHFLGMNEEEQERLFYPEAGGGITPQASKVMPDYITIHHELKKKHQSKVTLALLHEEYKEAHPLSAYSYTQFREHYVRFLHQINPSMRQVHLGGEKVFVDYSGLGIPIVNPKTGEVHIAQIFVAVLGASGYTFVHATYSQKQRDFILSHVLAYDFFGGAPKIVVPDNLKSAVIKHSKKEGIILNESYAALARHYGMAVEPTRPYKPKDKAKVELGVKGIQRWILAKIRHQTFFSVDELNAALSKLLDAYNAKVIKRLQKSRTALLQELDLPFLQPLPLQRYVYRDFKEATVAHNYHIVLEGCEYSVPYTYLGYKVSVWYSSHSVEIAYKGIKIALHPKLYFAGGVSTLPEHMPSHHQYQHEKMNPARYLNWANAIGDHTLSWVKHEFEHVTYPPNAYRKLNAVLSMAKLYGKEELDLTLLYALSNRIRTTASIRSILDKKLYLQKPANNSAAPEGLFNNHENIRGNIYH